VIRFVLPTGHDFTIHDYRANAGRNIADRLRVLRYEDLPERDAFDRGAYVLAGLEGLGAGMLRFLGELHGRLSGVEGFRFLNHPTRSLRRFDLLAELSRTGRNDFRAVRAGGDLSGLRYPVFLRPETLHSGAISPLLRSAREVERAIGNALLFGHRLQDLLVVEFCDTADGDGFYRKYAAFVVGDRVLARSLEYGRAWMLKDAGNEFSLAMVEEERAFVQANPHAKELGEIFRIAGIEYGRIDYAIKNGRVQTWEINLHPTIGPDPHPPRNPVPEELKPIRRQSRDHFYREFEAAWRAVDRESEARPPVRLGIEETILREARRPAFPRGALLRRARRLFRPLRPLRRVLVPFFGALGRTARAARARSER
jgi:hypothetical protein